METENRTIRRRNLGKAVVLFLLLAVPLICPCLVHGDTGAVVEATAAGGLQWTREPRVSMVKERLTISLNKVTVEFEFLNESDQDITAQVGFPLPPYEFEFLQHAAFSPNDGHRRSISRRFDDFAIWIDDKPGKYETEERAFLNGVEHTEILRRFDINIGTFGDKIDDPFYDSEPNDELTRLPQDQKDQLMKLGLLGGRWTVHKMYHWTQLFPAKKIVRIMHEYTPVEGFRAYIRPESLRELDDTCLGDDLLKRAQRLPRERARSAEQDFHIGQAAWVKYILTSANTWKTPIKDFELIVEKGSHETVSFCWDGKIEQLDEKRVVARAKDFVPTKELTIYFFW